MLGLKDKGQQIRQAVLGQGDNDPNKMWHNKITKLMHFMQILGFWGFGVLGFWGFGGLGFWGFGVLGVWR
jgi:hypothetical protein